MGKNIYIDLGNKEVKIKREENELLEKYVGGTGVATKILWDNTEPKIDPLSPENMVLFTTGPLTGTPATSSGSLEICFKSPLTGLFGESRVGGKFAPKIKSAGFDNIIVTGKSEKPVYIWINNDSVELKSAEHLWGVGTYQTTKAILKETDEEASVACIGPAGENQVKFSGIMVDKEGAAMRCGGGAVLGSKNLKAVAVNGTQDVRIGRVNEFRDVMEEANTAMKNYPFMEPFSKQGTWCLIEMLEGALPTKNWQTCFFEDSNNINAEEFLDNYFVKSGACPSCPIGCRKYTEVKSGKYSTPLSFGPEYETIDMFGPNLGIDDPEFIIRINYLCNDFGLDTVSTGAIISYLMECMEKGVISKSSLGYDLKWGERDGIIDIIEKISKKKGIGKTLSKGVKKVSEKWGGEEFAMHVKGLEIPAHDARAEKSLALQYMTSPRGGCHMSPNWASPWDEELDCGLEPFDLPPFPEDSFEETEVGRAKAYKLIALHGTIAGMATTCVFPLWGPENGCLTPKLFAKMISAVTGKTVDQFGLMKKAERVYNLKRCYNIREGMTRDDETLPKRFKEPIKSGPTKGVKVEDEKAMLKEFYDECEWSEEGIPRKETLDKLEIGEIAEQL